MEFGEKIKVLRNQNKLTQEQLAEKLYVSRTAVSKWESGKGYPNIDSLKDIARLFDVTVDDLLSSEELLDVAKEENSTNLKRTTGLICGLLDIVSILFMFLPIYAHRVGDFVYSVPLISANGISMGIKISYMVIFSILSLTGVAELVLSFVGIKRLSLITSAFSLGVQACSILFFALSRQAYLTSFVFIILIFKVMTAIKQLRK